MNEDKTEVLFVISKNEKYLMLHHQDCCEDVYLEDICGNLDDLLGSEVLECEKVFEKLNDSEKCTEWTFYKIGTRKGFVSFRWYGSSNGYYSTTVSFIKWD